MRRLSCSPRDRKSVVCVAGLVALCAFALDAVEAKDRGGKGGSGIHAPKGNGSARQTTRTDFGAVLGRGITKPADVEAGTKKKGGPR
jgi:hypothetical protein